MHNRAANLRPREFRCFGVARGPGREMSRGARRLSEGLRRPATPPTLARLGAKLPAVGVTAAPPWAVVCQANCVGQAVSKPLVPTQGCGSVPAGIFRDT